MADRVLITGGAGFIGLHLASRLLADGHEVVLVDDLSRGRRDRELVRILRHAELIECDVAEPWAGKGLARAYDAVYHLAGVVGVRNVAADPGRTLRVNVGATLNLAQWCLRHQPGKVFFGSTSEVADGAGQLSLAAYPLPESVPFALVAPRSPRAVYALSKMTGEAALLHLGGPTVVRIGRYHNAYGPRMGTAHVIPELIGRLRRGDDPLTLPGAGQSRSFCFVSDAVDATVRLMAVSDPAPIVANIGNDAEEVTIADLATRLCAVAGRHPRVRPLPAPEGSPQRRRPDLITLRSLTGYEPQVPLAAGLRLTYAWYARAGQAR